MSPIPASLCLLVLTMGTISQCTAVTLTASTRRISRQGTPNFSLQCKEDGDNEQIEELHRLRILKFEMNGWVSVMEMDSDWISPKGRGGVTGSGVIADDQRSGSVKAVWSLATNMTSGEYVCDAMGYSGDGQGAWRKSTSVVVEMEAPLSLYSMLTMVDRSSKRIDAAVEMLEDRIDEVVERLEDTIDEKIQSYAVAQEGFLPVQKLSKKPPAPVSPPKKKLPVPTLRDATIVSEEPTTPASPKSAEVENGKKDGAERVSSNVKIDDNAEEAVNDSSGEDALPTEQWPAGTFGLLQTESGCPENLGVIFHSGWRKHHTESTDLSRDTISQPAHMKYQKESISTNFITQYFCTVKESSEGGAWPAGSYCIHKKGACPAGFDYGYIHWDDEDTNNLSEFGGDLPSSSLGDTYTRLTYCCRNDSSPEVAIKLPTSRPFYLYRYQGVCQAVEGMTYTNEFIRFHADCCGSRFQPFTPDGKEALPDVKIEMCYYEANA